MSPLLLVITTAALGIEVGWQPLPGGGHEYTIQIEPQLLDVLERGTDEIFSEVPPELNVRRYRIKVGSGPLPRDAGNPTPAQPAQPDREPPAKADDVAHPPPADSDDSFDLPSADRTVPADDGGVAPDFGTEPAAQPPGETPPADDARRDDAGNAIVGSDAARERTKPRPPAKLPPAGDAQGPIEQATFDAQQPDAAHDAATVETQKPKLPEGTNRPWTVLVAAVALLGCSLGANLYLGWVAWDARNRYRGAVAKFRTAS